MFFDVYISTRRASKEHTKAAMREYPILGWVSRLAVNEVSISFFSF
jgi:hypothetical protein